MNWFEFWEIDEMRNRVRREGWDLMRERWVWRNGVELGVNKRGCVAEVWKERRDTMGKLGFKSLHSSDREKQSVRIDEKDEEEDDDFYLIIVSFPHKWFMK